MFFDHFPCFPWRIDKVFKVTGFYKFNQNLLQEAGPGVVTDEAQLLPELTQRFVARQDERTVEPRGRLCAKKTLKRTTMG